jgi:gliding motility-associated-like protein
VGSKSVFKATRDPGIVGLNTVFDYTVPGNAGQLLQAYSDSIVVQWGFNRGTYQLGVQEITDTGCAGDWAYLDVAVVGTEAVFSQDRYTICNGNAVEIMFNESDFQAYQWADYTIINNTITKAGTYELKTIDWNGCLITNFITVIESPTPTVALGKDTMVCTPEFRLHALNPNRNPQGTVYTWSTGQTGTSSFIDISGHDTKENIVYWVRADLDGCTASDTVVVLACEEAPEPVLFRIPNTFTPNGDGDNDVWEIKVLSEYPNAVVEVFDRWGRKVFTSARGYPQPWDGRDTNGNVLPMEAYYYVINLNDGKSSRPLLGTISIIR